MDKISILLPSRSRPDQLEDFLTSVRNTSVDLERLEIVVRLDECDRCLEDNKKVLDNCGLFNKYVIGKRIFYSGDLWNDAYEKSSGDIYLVAHDDLRIRSFGWDIKVRSVFNRDKLKIVYCDDGFYEKTRCVFPIVHNKLTNILGYVIPSGIRDVGYLYPEWLMDIGRRTKNLLYIDNYYLEHCSLEANKRIKTDLNIEKTEEYKSSCNEIFDQLESLRAQDAQRIINANSTVI